MHRYLTRAALVVLGGAVVLAGTGCATTGVPVAGPTTSAPATGEDGLGSAPPGSGGPDDPVSAPSPTSGGGSGDGSTGGGPTGQQGGHGQSGGNTPKKSAPAGPTILVFKIAQQPQCPQGTNVNPIPGVPVVLSWKVKGTDAVTLSVDGPGVYDTFPAEGSATFDFPCFGAPGDEVTHTYQLRTVGGGEVRSKTLTAAATVRGIADVKTP
ncbi:hypothetical protein [Plantactinospora sonchi]|uniref:Uncharacterized protein n=1 Tax=Plantactinospora sonchi TaxID=1544735 RepID=A0ABU7RP50_9ACTN